MLEEVRARLRAHDRLRVALSWVLWPALMTVCIAATAYGFVNGHPYLAFNLSYLFLIISLLLLERIMPHEEKWLKGDGQTFANIAHTLTSKGTTQALLYVNALIGATEVTSGMSLDEGLGYSLGYWPYAWSLVAQVCLAVVLAEFMLYWAHRTAHEFNFLWRFHAVHHSVTRLWIVNTGRFHFVDSLYSIVLGLIPLMVLGAPMAVMTWVGVVTAFIGMLTHCNVEMRFGPISYVFNTPELHRWHHSKDLREGNKNYCENIMLWDIAFRTYFNERRRPPADIGIRDYMPPKFTQQIAWPFLTKKAKSDVEGRNRLV